jgi:hypothetical protein
MTSIKVLIDHPREGGGGAGSGLTPCSIVGVSSHPGTCSSVPAPIDALRIPTDPFETLIIILGNHFFNAPWYISYFTIKNIFIYNVNF